MIKPERPTKNLFEDAMAWTEYVAKLEQYTEELERTYAEMHKHFNKYRGKIDIKSDGRNYMDWVEEIIDAYIAKCEENEGLWEQAAGADI